MTEQEQGRTRTVRMGRSEVQPLGGGAGCLGMLLFLTVGVGAPDRPGEPLFR